MNQHSSRRRGPRLKSRGGRAKRKTVWERRRKERGREQGKQHSRSTNPEKKTLIHCITTIFGTIITACFFIPSIIPSICAGSANGFTGPSGFPLPALAPEGEVVGGAMSAPVDSWVCSVVERDV